MLPGDAPELYLTLILVSSVRSQKYYRYPFTVSSDARSVQAHSGADDPDGLRGAALASRFWQRNSDSSDRGLRLVHVEIVSPWLTKT